MIGQVIRIAEGKHFGFINYNNKDYFFHVDDYLGNWTELKRDMKLLKTIRVNFEEGNSAKGPRARNVSLVEE